MLNTKRSQTDRQTDGQTDEKIETDNKWPSEIDKEIFCKKETERERRERGSNGVRVTDKVRNKGHTGMCT